MMRNPIRKSFTARILLVVLVTLAYAPDALAIFGVRRRTFIVAYSMGMASASQQQAAAAQQTAAAQQASSSSQAAAASAQHAAAAASKAAASSAAPQKTPQQQLQDLKSLYDQGLISKSEYEAAQQKIIAKITQ